MSILWHTKRVWQYMFLRKNIIIRKRTILLLRLDGIGDYVLFRNFIKEIKKSEEYKNYSITLCGNIIWKDIATAFDCEEIDKFIWIDKNKFKIENLKYYFTKIASIHFGRFEILIHPTFSRDKIAETIVKYSGAKYKIGNTGDCTNLSCEDKIIYNKCYDKLLPASVNVLFEFERNKEFFNNLLGCEIKLKKPVIEIPSSNAFKQDYIIIFLGSTSENRRWHWNNYKNLIDLILKKYNGEIIICGGDDVAEAANNIMGANSKRLLNMVGETSLYELILYINKAQMVITNDTCALHIAAATGTKVVCASNGNSFGRFVPYPDYASNKVKFVFVDEIENNLQDFVQLSNKYNMYSDLDINKISYLDVFRVIEQFFLNEVD